MKKLLLVSIFFLVLLFPAFAQEEEDTIAPPTGFPDVSSDNEFYEAINYVKKNGIVNGYSDGTFKPTKEVSRGELTKIVIGSIYTPDIVDACGVENYFKENVNPWGNNFEDIFPDVWGGYDGISPNEPTGRNYITEEGFVYPVAHVFFNHICLAKKDSIISGFSDGTFGPDLAVEFQASAKILANSFSMEPDLSMVSEEDKLKPFIIRMGEYKAIPMSIKTREQKVTRGELAEMIFRIQTDNVDKESRTFEDFQEVTVQEQGSVESAQISYTPVPSPTPEKAAESYACSCSKTCTQMNSCSEAYYQLNTCGCSARDGDNDGVPCEDLCG